MTGLRNSLYAVAVLSAGVIGAGAVPSPAFSQDDEAADKAIEARQGYMQLVLRSAGPLFGMAKGDVAYDADAATKHVANLQALAQYDYPALFEPGSSKEDRPGETRMLADAPANPDKVQQAFSELGAAVDGVAAAAAAGQAELAAAVGAMGKTCGDCHNAFRAKEF